MPRTPKTTTKNNERKEVRDCERDCIEMEDESQGPSLVPAVWMRAAGVAGSDKDVGRPQCTVVEPGCWSRYPKR